ncbi:fumarylacetoacetate hydrolase family protein [Streptomyces sp. NPDC017979]|uniref:fumarylacetoacetate hydrolase family protein n=1 Tax=Streptomyces sp. NPDC017979 TaxID=3365024 RepID=UPI0037981FD1
MERQRYVRFEHLGRARFGRVAPTVDDVTPIEVLSDDPVRTDASPTGELLEMEEVHFLSPLLPGRVVAVRDAYANAPSDPPRRTTPPCSPHFSLSPPPTPVNPHTTVDPPARYAAELAVVIGRDSRVFGYTCANALTPDSLSLGPWIVTGIDPASLRIGSMVNGVRRQESTTARLPAPVAPLLAHITATTPLAPGDVVLTGTPTGAGELAPGDWVTVFIEHIGTLGNKVSPSHSH